MRACRFLASAIVPLTLAAFTAAHADPCEGKVAGYKAGAVISGTIRYVGDGDGLCVGRNSNPKTWTEIRLADFYAPELNEKGGRSAKAALNRFKGRSAACTVRRGRNGATRSYDRLIASCTIEGRPLAELLRRSGVHEGGRGR